MAVVFVLVTYALKLVVDMFPAATPVTEVPGAVESIVTITIGLSVYDVEKLTAFDVGVFAAEGVTDVSPH